MWEMKCPKCGEGIKWWPNDLLQPSCDKKKCVYCAEEFELANPAVCSVINGLMFSSILVVLSFVGLQWQWLKALIAGFFSWFIHPFIVRILGRWRGRSYQVKDLRKARTWALVSTASGWVFGIVVAFTAIGFVLLYRELLIGLGDTESAIGSEAVEDFTRGLKFWLPIGVGTALSALALAKIASLMRLKLRNNQQLEDIK